MNRAALQRVESLRRAPDQAAGVLRGSPDRAHALGRFRALAAERLQALRGTLAEVLQLAARLAEYRLEASSKGRANRDRNVAPPRDIASTSDTRSAPLTDYYGAIVEILL